jgi:YD repeat-containing protein
MYIDGMDPYPEQFVETYEWTYDADGHEIAADRNDGERWRWTWSGGLRMREDNWKGDRGSHRVVDWTYDAEGRLLTEVIDGPRDAHSEESFSYDCWETGGPPDPETLGCTDFRESAGTYVAVSVGGCAIRLDGTLACWGSTDLDPPAGQFVSIVGQGCAIRAEDARLACFRTHSSARPWPWPVPEGSFIAVGLGGDFGCALREEGTLACWGDWGDAREQPPDGGFAALSVGLATSCALDADGFATCWAGQNVGGEADAPLDEAFRQLDVGSRHGCAVTMDGALRCWGNAPETGPGTYGQVSVGGYGETTCAIRDDDATLACWGALPAPEGRFTAIDLDITERAACALREDQHIVCWGDNEQGYTTPP